MEVTYNISHKELISVLQATLRGGLSCYMAVPITSGKRLWSLASRLKVNDVELVRERFRDVFVEEVLVPNETIARRLAEELAERVSPMPVIDPSRVVINGWSTHDYRAFWKDVILDCVKTVYLAPGWEYSHGCVEECLAATQLGREVFTFNGAVMTLPDIASAIERAMSEAGALGLTVDYLAAASKIRPLARHVDL